MEIQYNEWLALTIIGASLIWGLVIVSVAEKFFDRKNSNETSKYNKT